MGVQRIALDTGRHRQHASAHRGGSGDGGKQAERLGFGPLLERGHIFAFISSPRHEEQCLIWAARGKTAEEIADVLNLAFNSVTAHLDTARHKLHCMNLAHAIAVAVATGVIPAEALQ